MPLFNQLLVNPAITYQKFMKFKESVRRGFIPNEMQDVTKNLSLEDDKRQWAAAFNPHELQYSKPFAVINGEIAKLAVIPNRTPLIYET
jgi:hypothetical protein